MRVHLTVKKSRLDQIYESTGILKWLLQVFALDSTERRVSRNEKCCYIFKAMFTAIIVGAFAFSSFHYKLNNTFNGLNLSISFTDCIQTTYDFFQYVVDLFVIFKYGRETSQEYFKQFACFDKSLNFSHYREVKERVTRMTTILLSLFLLVSTLDFTGWYVSYGLVTTAVYSIAYVFLLIKVLSNLDLTTQVINVECRLRVIGDWMQCYYECCNSKSSELYAKSSFEDPVTNKNWFYIEDRDRISVLRSKASKRHPSRIVSLNNFNEIKWLSRCYLLLNEQCIFITKFYGIRLLLQTLSLLIDMVRYLNVSVRLAIGSQKTPFNAGYFPVLTCMTRFVFSGVVMTNLVCHCEQAYRQLERIQALTDHIFINKDPDAALRSSITELRDLVNLRPISFNMANFFRLSFSFLVSTASVVVTYAIILLQGL